VGNDGHTNRSLGVKLSSNRRVWGRAVRKESWYGGGGEAGKWAPGRLCKGLTMGKKKWEERGQNRWECGGGNRASERNVISFRKGNVGINGWTVGGG